MKKRFFIIGVSVLLIALMAGIGFAVFIMTLALDNTTLAGCFATIIIGLLMLVLQIVNTFSDKQF